MASPCLSGDVWVPGPACAMRKNVPNPGVEPGSCRRHTVETYESDIY